LFNSNFPTTIPDFFGWLSLPPPPPHPSPPAPRVEHVNLTMTDFSRQELDPPEAVDLETTAKIKVPSQITQPDVNNDQTTVGIVIIGHSGLSVSQADSGIQNSSSCDLWLSSWH